MTHYWPYLGSKRPEISQTHLGTWLGSLSGKALEIASDVLQLLSDSSKGESLAGHQPGSSNPRDPLDQLLDRGPGNVITVSNNVLGARMVALIICFICSSRHRNSKSSSSSSCYRATFRLAISFRRVEG